MSSYHTDSLEDFAETLAATFVSKASPAALQSCEFDGEGQLYEQLAELDDRMIG